MTNTTLTETEALLSRVRELCTQVKKAAPSDVELVDRVGQLGEIIDDLNTTKRMWLSEVAPGALGESYRAYESRPVSRSYNTDGILAAVQGDRGAWGAFQYLLRKDAVRLQWRWTQLKSVFNALDVPLVVVGHEIEDGDPAALVGEVPQPRTVIEPVTREKR